MVKGQTLKRFRNQRAAFLNRGLAVYEFPYRDELRICLLNVSDHRDQVCQALLILRVKRNEIRGVADFEDSLYELVYDDNIKERLVYKCSQNESAE